MITCKPLAAKESRRAHGTHYTAPCTRSHPQDSVSFTVYGPLGRPDMAPVLFMKAIMEDRPIKVFNHGNLFRDFHIILMICQGIAAVFNSPAPTGISHTKYSTLALFTGCSDGFHLAIEMLQKKGNPPLSEMQPAMSINICRYDKMEKEFGYKPQTTIREGVKALYEACTDSLILGQK